MSLEIIRRAFNISEFDKEVSFDRLFPNQDFLPVGGFGNLIALPLQGRYVKQENALFTDSGSGEPYPDQWDFLATSINIPLLNLMLRSAAWMQVAISLFCNPRKTASRATCYL